MKNSLQRDLEKEEAILTALHFLFFQNLKNKETRSLFRE